MFDNGTFKEKVESIDWDFKGADTQYLTHKYHSYPARFIPQIPKNFIEILTKPGDWVLDPLCGCGTTLVEAMLAKRNTVGVDLNPLADLITRVKVTPLEPIRLSEYAKKFRSDVSKRILALRDRSLEHFLESSLESSEVTQRMKTPVLPARKLSRKFTPQILKDLAILKSCIEKTENEDYRRFLQVCLSSSIRTIIESNSIEIDLLKIFLNKSDDMIQEMGEFYRLVSPAVTEAHVHKEDARKMHFIPSDSIDLVVTSPPYVNALDYHREHMYNMVWLGMNYKIFKKHEIGAHSHFIANRFRLLTEYWADMSRCIIEMNRVLKIGRFACIVVGNSCVEHELIESWKHFSEIGKRIRMSCEKVIHRYIDVSQKYTSKIIGNINDEYIVMFRKVKETDYNSLDDNLILEIVMSLWEDFRNLQRRLERLEKSKQLCFGRLTSRSRNLDKNIAKMDEAISLAQKDILIKD